MLSSCSMPRYHLPYFNWGSGSLIMLPNCLTHLSKSTRASDKDSPVYSEIRIPWAMFGSQLNFPFIILSTFTELKLWHVSRRLTPITSIPICLLFQILWNTLEYLHVKAFAIDGKVVLDSSTSWDLPLPFPLYVQLFHTSSRTNPELISLPLGVSSMPFS